MSLSSITSTRFLLRTEREVHVDHRDYLNRVAVEKSRFVAPLFDGLDRNSGQQWGAAYQLEVPDSAVATDDGLDPDGAFDARGPGERRISRLRSEEQFGGLHATPDTNWR